MKAISLSEPWATLIALGLKRYETRSWSTIYRGALLICASKKRPPFIQIVTILSRACLGPDNLSPGRALALVDLVECLKTDFLIVPEEEKFYGDFSPGRFAWKLENIRRFKNPPPIRGKLGLFDVDDFYKSLDTYPSI